MHGFKILPFLVLLFLASLSYIVNNQDILQTYLYLIPLLLQDLRVI
jgi:hypothetical protein